MLELFYLNGGKLNGSSFVLISSDAELQKDL